MIRLQKIWERSVFKESCGRTVKEPVAGNPAIRVKRCLVSRHGYTRVRDLGCVEVRLLSGLPLVGSNPTAPGFYMVRRK